MAYFTSGTFSTANALLQALAAFVAENGWTVDFAGTYNTSYYRVHFHRDAAHFDFWSSSATVVNSVGCTAYTSGSAPTAQTGVSGLYKTYTGVVGQPYKFVSTEGGIFISVQTATYHFWGGCGVLQEKIGSYTEGYFIQGGYSALYVPTGYGTSGGGAQLYYNAAWSPTVAAGGLSGLGADNILMQCQPCTYNGAVVPLKFLLAVRNTSDSTLFHPVGYLPGVYRFNGGDLYVPDDTITIDGDTYLVEPAYQKTIGDTTWHDLLFKLGALT